MVMLRLQLETDGRGNAFWTIKSPDVPGLYARDSSIFECQRVAVSILDAVNIDTNDVRFELAS